MTSIQEAERGDRVTKRKTAMKRAAKSTVENPTLLVPLRIVVEGPPEGVAFGLQKGKGNDGESAQTQVAKGSNLTFDFEVEVKDNRDDGLPNFHGPYAQRPATERFVYLVIGIRAGQTDSPWDRRIKVPLAGVTWDMIRSVLKTPGHVLEATIPGTGKDGGPSCATVRPVKGWVVVLRR